MRISRRCGAMMLILLVPAAALACLWDSETLKQERSRFPSTLELITGKFLRHSPAFYEWRIKDRLEKLKTDPKNVGLYDDIAVAYEKLGQHDKAIETILAKEEIQPGLYETYSNLGTFYILAGELEKGLPYIDQALAINPDAHFGREKYQKWLVEYALTRRKGGKVSFPLSQGIPTARGAATSYAQFVAQRLGTQQLSREQTASAVTGVLGMMRFANYRNPLLLEALADLLIEGDQRKGDAKQLAARALLQASYVVGDGQASAQYRKRAERALNLQTAVLGSTTQMPLSDLESQFKRELAEADAWYQGLEKMESDWIQAGADVEANFDKFYSQDPVISPSQEPAADVGIVHSRTTYSKPLLDNPQRPEIPTVRSSLNPAALLTALALIVVIAGSALWWRMHRQAPAFGKGLKAGK